MAKRFACRALALGLMALSGCCASHTVSRPDAPAVAAASAASSPRSPYLQHPEKAIDWMVKNAEFWKKTYDPVHGGYFTLVREDGTIPDPNYKSTLSQSRVAYAFARAYMVTGNREYLTFARRAVDFMAAHSWDRQNGGFHTCVGLDGESLDHSPAFDRVSEHQRQKWSFMQEYGLLGIAAVYDANRRDEDLAFLTRARATLDEKLWDGRKGLEGYYDAAEEDWSRPHGKGFTPTVDAFTTHGEAAYLLTRDPRYKERLLQLADEIVDHLVATMDTRKLGIEELYDSDWNPAGKGHFFVGHLLKTAWCLERAYLVSPNEKYRAAADRILQQVWGRAWDHTHGGPFQYGDSLRGAITDRNKLYWGLEQAITGGLAGYYLTGNQTYLEMADRSLEFYDRYLYDWKYGDVIDTVSEDGSRRILTDKGGYWKSAYHAMEVGYYVYLYGNLYLQRRPAALHYWIDRSTQDRTLPLDPIAIQDGALVISEVARDGEPYSGYDGRARTLWVPAGVEGDFRVTFVNVRER